MRIVVPTLETRARLAGWEASLAFDVSFPSTRFAEKGGTFSWFWE
jgi:hypothetical protein